VQLTEFQWKWLEKYRAKHGLKSISEALRKLVEEAMKRGE